MLPLSHIGALLATFGFKLPQISLKLVLATLGAAAVVGAIWVGRSHVDALHDALASAQSDLKRTQSELVAARAGLQGAAVEIDALRAQHADQARRLADLENRNRRARSEASELRARLAQLELETRIHENPVDAARALTDRDRELNRLLERASAADDDQPGR